MAELLANLDLGLHFTAGASERLRSHVARIDDYMQAQRRLVLFDQQQPQHVPRRSNSDASANPYQPDPNQDAYAVDGGGNLGGVPSTSEFQLPPELLEDWPWAFDFAQIYTG